MSTFNTFKKLYSFQVSHTVIVAVIINQLATTQMVLLTGFRLLTRQHQARTSLEVDGTLYPISFSEISTYREPPGEPFGGILYYKYYNGRNDMSNRE
jgi:hypothetical protein